jgi:hypothetical protein
MSILAIRTLNTYSGGQSGLFSMHDASFAEKYVKKMKRDNFFKAIFQHDPEHLEQV